MAFFRNRSLKTEIVYYNVLNVIILNMTYAVIIITNWHVQLTRQDDCVFKRELNVSYRTAISRLSPSFARRRFMIISNGATFTV